MSINLALAVDFTVNNQADWDNIPEPLPSGDVVTINSGVVITNMVARTIFGNIINNGDFTMNGPAGVGIPMMGMIVNNGTFTVGTVGLSIIDGEFTNVGTLNVNSAAIVIQTDGILTNTGTINNNVDIQNNGIFRTCGSISGSGTLNGTALMNSVSIGTLCDDMDATTEDDMIVDANCTCMGTSTIPSASEWALLILGMVLTSLGLIYLKEKGSIFLKA